MKLTLKSPKTESVMRVFLEEVGINRILLKGEDEAGFVWNLLELSPEGIYRCSGIDEKLGFALSKERSMIALRN